MPLLKSMKPILLLCFILGVSISGFAADFVTVSPSGNIQIKLRTIPGKPSIEQTSWDVYVQKGKDEPRLVPFEVPEINRSTLGISNLNERRYHWMGERYCVTTISYGLGILDIEQARWVCNTTVNWGFANGRGTVVYVEFGHPSDTSVKSDSISVYRFDSVHNLGHKIHPLAGLVISPIFENRSNANVAFIQQLPNKEKQLVIFGTDTGKTLATRTLPKRFASLKTLWVDDIKKQGRQQNRELLEWIESATKYGPFWEPDADGF